LEITMPQALVVQFINDVQNRDYQAGAVVDFPVDLLAWLKTRKMVDDTAAVVAAAVAGGAVPVTHTPGVSPILEPVVVDAGGVLRRPDGQVVGGGFVYAESLGLRSYPTWQVSADQTEKLREILSSLVAGQTLILPESGWIPLFLNDGVQDITWPAGVTVRGGATLWCGNTSRPKGKFRIAATPLPTQRNTRFERLIFKRSEWIIVSDNPGVERKSDVVFDGVHLDGTAANNTGSAGASCVLLGQDTFNIHFAGETRINNYAGWAVDIQGNAETTPGQINGTPYLGAGVYITFGPEMAVRNCGGASDGLGGLGGAIRVRGSCADGTSIHLMGTLLDGCQQALYIDDENGTNGAASGGGGITVIGAGVRVERCGRVGSTFVSAIYNRRGLISIANIWGARPDGTPPADWKFIENVKGQIQIGGGRITGVASNQFVIHSTGVGSRAEYGGLISGGQMRGVETPMSASGFVRHQAVYLRVRLTKTATANAWTAQVLDAVPGNYEGRSTGLGQIPTTVSGEFLINSVNSVNVGSGEAQITFGGVAATNIVTIELPRGIQSIMACSISRQTSGANLYCDSLIQAGTDQLRLLFSDTSGTAFNLATASTGVQIDVQVAVTTLPLGVA